MWFYKEPTRRFYLSYVRISGASGKLPIYWKENSAHIVARVGCDQTTHTDDNIYFILNILDQDYCNTDQIPVCIDIPGNYTWCKINTGRQKLVLVLHSVYTRDELLINTSVLDYYSKP